MADFSKLKRRTLGPPPSPDEASDNLERPELAPPAAEPAAESLAYRRRDGRSLRRTNRTIQFATRVTPDFDRRIRDAAAREGLLIVEVLERALDAYESKQLSGRKKAAR
jgi:hypothetical protein